MPLRPRKLRTEALMIPLAVLAALVGTSMLISSRQDALVVYCAHDALYSEEVLRRFEEQAGIAVRAKFDTEATKSLGLTELIIRQQEAPVCDIFWNNELFGTMALAERGLLEPYSGSHHERIPPQFRDPEGRWCGFGGRFRVFMVNTESSVDSAAGAAGILASDPSRFAIAKPLYGTTFTHYTVLWDELGGEGLKRWHHDLRERGINEVLGNATVKNMVAAGTCAAGWTDTDDYFLAEDANRPVAMQPARTPSGQTICIPNTVAIIKGTRQLDAAKRLVDFLLSEANEVNLANSRARQVPLGPVDDADLPEQVRRMRPWVEEGAILYGLGEARAACLQWLREEYGGTEG